MRKSFNAYWPAAAFILSVALGGLGAIGVRYTDLELPPNWGAALRIAPAAMIMFLLAFLMKLQFPRGRALLGTIAFGMLNFGGSYAFIYYGLEKVKPGLSMVILALVPLFTLILTVLHRQETFRLQALLGSLVAAGGVALVCQQELKTNVPFSSLLALILGGVCIAESSVIAKSFSHSHPITTNAIGMSAGAIVLITMSLTEHEERELPTKPSTWGALIYLILISTCTVFVLFLYILKRWPASRISYQFVLYPFVTITASAWITQESLSPILLVGAGLVLAGVCIGAMTSTRRKIVVSLPATNMVTYADEVLEKKEIKHKGGKR